MPPLRAIRLQQAFTPLILVFTLCGTALLGAAVLYSQASATIVVTPRIHTINASFSLPVLNRDTDNKEALPATVTTATEQATVTVTPSGDGALVDAHATGDMTVINTTNSPQALTTGTRFRASNGIIVRSTKRVDVPAHGQITVSVVADPLGISGNLDAGRFVIVALWPGLQDKIYGQTSAPMSGGQVRQGSTLDTASLTKASTDAVAAIREKLGVVPDGTIRFFDPTKVESNPSSTTPSASYQVTVTATVTTIEYDQTALDREIRAHLATQVIEGETIQGYSAPTMTRTSDPALTVRIGVEARAAATADSPIFTQLELTGRTRGDITKQLEATNLVEAVTVTITPGWQSTTPQQRERIHVIVNSPRP